MKIKLISKYKPKLYFLGKIYQCQIGFAGVVSKFQKKEGDKSTPRGKWKLGKIFMRREELFKLKINRFFRKNLFCIKDDYSWCDDPKSRLYNKFFKKKNSQELNFYSYENLFRNDNVYNIIIEICFNSKPVIKGKGSAIFIHCSFDDSRATAGCIALNKKSLKYLISNLQNKNSIYIQ